MINRYHEHRFTLERGMASPDGQGIAKAGTRTPGSLMPACWQAFRRPSALIGLWTAMLLLSACSPPVSVLQNAMPKRAPAMRANTAEALLLHAPVGTVEMRWNPGQHRLTLVIRVSGLAPGSAHPAHIHPGTCAAPGPILYTLSPLVANPFGQASMFTTITNVAHLPAQRWLIDIHNGPTMAEEDEENIAIACGAFTTPESGAGVPLHEQVPLQATTVPNESASGTAHLWIDAHGSLKVTVKVSGLAAGSRHAIHIHAGSCQRQGNMLYPLPPLVADQQGHAAETATFPHVGTIPASGWYLNVHFAQTIVTPQGNIIPQAFNPIACGNVTVR
jgi:Cu/Zn superoxide dismutase